MPIPDDERFESYLKGFRLRAAEPLRMQSFRRARWPALARARWVAAAAAMVIAAVVAWQTRGGQSPSTGAVESGPRIERRVSAQPLTLRRANALLAAAPSFKAAVDEMAFPRKAPPPPTGKLSALAVLSEEKNKL